MIAREGYLLHPLKPVLALLFCVYLRMRMTMVVIMAARNTKPPKTPKAIMPPV